MPLFKLSLRSTHYFLRSFSNFEGLLTQWLVGSVIFILPTAPQRLLAQTKSLDWFMVIGF